MESFNEIFIVLGSVGIQTILEKAMWGRGMRVYLKEKQRAASVVSCWRKPKLFWCRRLWGSRWLHHGVTGAAGYHARMRLVKQKPIYIRKSLTVCKQSVLCQWTSSVQLTSVMPVTVRRFLGSEWCTCPDEAHWGTLQRFPIKAVQSHRDPRIWLKLEKRRVSCVINV